MILISTLAIIQIVNILFKKIILNKYYIKNLKFSFTKKTNHEIIEETINELKANIQESKKYFVVSFTLLFTVMYFYGYVLLCNLLYKDNIQLSFEKTFLYIVFFYVYYIINIYEYKVSTTIMEKVNIVEIKKDLQFPIRLIIFSILLYMLIQIQLIVINKF